MRILDTHDLLIEDQLLIIGHFGMKIAVFLGMMLQIRLCAVIRCLVEQLACDVVQLRPQIFDLTVFALNLLFQRLFICKLTKSCILSTSGW